MIKQGIVGCSLVTIERMTSDQERAKIAIASDMSIYSLVQLTADDLRRFAVALCEFADELDGIAQYKDGGRDAPAREGDKEVTAGS